MKLADAWPRQPFIGIGAAAIVGIAVADAISHSAVGMAITLLSAVIALTRRSSPATYIFVVCAFYSLHSVRQTASPGVRLARDLGREPKAAVARGIVVSEPRISARGGAFFLLKLSSITLDGEQRGADATIWAHWRGKVRFGDELQLFGVLAPTEPPRNPGEFDMRRYLARQDVHRALVVRYPENGKILARGRGNPIKQAALSSRKWMEAALAHGLTDSPDLHGLISSMVLGARDETPDEIEEQFQQTGTLHLFAVSGLNVAIVAQLLWTIANAARVPRKWAIGFIVVALFFYAAVTGLNASSVRAALMAALFLCGFFVERKVLLGNTVAAAAVLVLCWDTNQLFSTGFQLSFAVVIVIILLADPLLHVMTRWSEPDPFLPRSLLSSLQRFWRRAWYLIARGASVSLAAWIGSLPLILPYFYLVTPVSLFANLVVVPLAFLVLAIGLMSLLVTPFAGWLAIIFNNANWSVAATILASVGLFARAPAGHFYLERPHWPDGARADITALDLRAGAGIHVRSRASDWLVDAGPERDFRRIVRGYLRSRGVNRLDGMMLTHGDSQHIGAVEALVRGFRPREIVDTLPPDRSRIHKQLIEFLAKREAPRRLCAAGDDVAFSTDVQARVLFPPAEHRATTADDQALVLRLLIGERWRVLLMSDSGETTEQMLLASGVELQSDIMIKGQHHSGSSGSSAFLDRVQPQLIIASSPEFPENERVKDDWAGAVAARGIRLLRQDHTGAVTVRFFSDRWEATSYLTRETFRADKR